MMNRNTTPPQVHFTQNQNFWVLVNMNKRCSLCACLSVVKKIIYF